MKDEIISYREMCNKVKINSLQKGMNFHIRKNLSVILMSVRPNAPYDDEIDSKSNLLVYEGHDVVKSKQIPYPKQLDQPLWSDRGTLTENGKFVRAVEKYKKGLSESEKVLVFEKLRSGVWSEKGLFNLVDYYVKEANARKVFKFILKPIDEEAEINASEDIEKHNRIIPTHIKVEVWKRDRGRCVLCNSKKNLHFDHDIPFSKGGSSIIAKNVRILCAKCNLKKRDKIE